MNMIVKPLFFLGDLLNSFVFKGPYELHRYCISCSLMGVSSKHFMVTVVNLG